MIRNRLAQLLWAPIIKGRLAFFCAIVAVALPTAVRLAANGIVTGCEFTPYLPFVLLSAIMLGARPACAVALASVAITGGLFLGPPSELFGMACFLSGAAIFLASSAIMIGIVSFSRHQFLSLQRRHADDSSNGVIFSLEKGEVWASWYGSGPPVRLGTQGKVSEMMEDFLKQVEVGKRLAKKPD